MIQVLLTMKEHEINSTPDAEVPRKSYVPLSMQVVADIVAESPFLAASFTNVPIGVEDVVVEDFSNGFEDSGGFCDINFD